MTTEEKTLTKTPRERIQDKIVSHLQDHSEVYGPSFGIMPVLEPLPRGGFVRSVQFGVPRTLDATVYIWSPEKLTIEARGALSYIFQDTYGSVEGFIADLRRIEPRTKVKIRPQSEPTMVL